ncbi:MAG: DUF2281 domain-containing protein [Candidatus Brocadiaceae bacterium]|nr:DUF2281 domain-containing protein [Candidatus Brocadiaceae bacterium]
MMPIQAEKILSQIVALPPEVQREVSDFIAFLKSRYKEMPPKKVVKKVNLNEEQFIGMWKDRQDMKDSASWVRNVRKKEMNENDIGKIK